MTLDDLRKIAEAATEGPWVAFGTDVGSVTDKCNCGPMGDPGHEQYCGVEGPIAQAGKPDAEFIATFNPERVLELLDQIEQLQAVVRDSHDNCTYQTRLAAVEKIADAIEEHDAPFEASPTAQWIRKAARGE